jgi:NADH-quinone oxidoreductase subunit E
MLSEQERIEIEEELPRYPTKRAVSIEALKVVQKHRGWVDDAAVRDIAAFLGMTPDELDNVATFYNMIFRRPVGRHVILTCDSVSCFIMGGETLREHLSTQLGIGLGETTTDGRFTMLPIVCLGDCDHAPTMMIDKDLHRNLTPEKLDTILERYE